MERDKKELESARTILLKAMWEQVRHKSGRDGLTTLVYIYGSQAVSKKNFYPSLYPYGNFFLIFLFPQFFELVIHHYFLKSDRI